MDEFHGKGYAGSPLTAEENARVRHMYSVVSEDWPVLRKMLVLIEAVEILYKIIRIGGPVLFALAVLGFYAKNQGII